MPPNIPPHTKPLSEATELWIQWNRGKVSITPGKGVGASIVNLVVS